MEEILLQFEELMEEYREAYERAPNDTAKEQVDRRFSDLLTSKEEEVEALMEVYLEEQAAILLAEQEASLKELEDQENEDVEEMPITGQAIVDMSSIECQLREFTVKEHKATLKEAGIKGYSKLKEDELIQLRIENKLF